MILKRFPIHYNFQAKYLVCLCVCGSLFLFIRHYPDYKFSCEGNLLPYPLCTDFRDLQQDDPILISYIRSNVLVPPSGLRYNLTHPEKKDFSQYKQGTYLKKYFLNKRNGTFIEAGAWDGEFLSNTLGLERQLGWTGLLVEPNPQRYPYILTKHRKAHSTNCCISLTTRPTELSISLDEKVSHIIGYFDKDEHTRTAKVNCFPLSSLMAAMQMTTLDFLSLDLESLEVKVLKTIPWEKVDIKSLLIEVNHIPEGKKYIRDFMAERNYVLENELDIDYFFVKKL